VAALGRAIREARELARAYHVNWRIMGTSTPLPDIENWSPAYREAFEDELAKLEAERVAGG
jgi:hypothetical protein